VFAAWLCCAGVGIADNPAGLYAAMHSYLAASAVDGVKVDCQAGVGLVGSCLGGGPAASRLFQAALEDSIAVHFPGNHAINCMCHSSENFYRWVGSSLLGGWVGGDFPLIVLPGTTWVLPLRLQYGCVRHAMHLLLSDHKEVVTVVSRSCSRCVTTGSSGALQSRCAGRGCRTLDALPC
jgi:hypothetical protein